MKEKLIELITAITKRPAMYGVNKVEDFALIIFGYIACSAVAQGTSSDFNTEFRNYVNKDFEMTGDHDWPRLIRFHSASDSHSIELFSKLFSKYLTSN
jgi:hypothetical protein